MGQDPEEPEVRRLVRSELPIVGVDIELEGPATAYVISDNEDGASRAVRHLHSIGHRRIATITGMLETRTGGDRLRGYRQALQACGLAYRDEYVAYGDFYVESGRRAMADLLSLDEPPTAVFAASDMMALGAIRAVGDAGLSVPADVSVIGFDDIQLADHMNPPLTTVRQDKAGLGAAAGSALVRLIDGEQDAVDALDGTSRRAHPARHHTAPDNGLGGDGGDAFPAESDVQYQNRFWNVSKEERIVRSRFAIVAMAIAAVLVGALVYSGCGGDDDDSSSTTGTTTNAAKSNATVRLWIMPNGPQPQEDMEARSRRSPRTPASRSTSRSWTGACSSTASATRPSPARPRT